MTNHAQITLDAALTLFEINETPKTASILLLVATTYWNDDMIGDIEYGDIVARCARSLA